MWPLLGSFAAVGLRLGCRHDVAGAISLSCLEKGWSGQTHHLGPLLSLLANHSLPKIQATRVGLVLPC